jgi:CHASE3 domain sensor protein
VRSPATWTLRARVTALSVVTALVLALIAAAAAAVAIGNRGDVDRLLNRDTPLAVNTRALLTALLDQETGIRGYAVNGGSADLDPYTQGVRDEATSETNLLQLAAHVPNSDLVAQVQGIQRQTAQWRQATAAPVIAAVRAGDLHGAQTSINDTSRRQFDTIRAAVGRLLDTINGVRDTTAQAVRDNSSHLVELLVAAGLVIILAGFSLVVSLRYLVIGPVARLAAEVRRVAAGDYEHVVSAEGPPELARLTSDVESMRRRISARSGGPAPRSKR